MLSAQFRKIAKNKMKALFPQLPKELEDHILEYASDHRRRMKALMCELMVHAFICVVKKRVAIEILSMLELDLQRMLNELEE